MIVAQWNKKVGHFPRHFKYFLISISFVHFLAIFMLNVFALTQGYIGPLSSFFLLATSLTTAPHPALEVSPSSSVVGVWVDPAPSAFV